MNGRARRRPASAIPKNATSRNPIPIQMNAIQMAGRMAAAEKNREAIIAIGIETPSATIKRVSARAVAGGRCGSRTSRAQR